MAAIPRILWLQRVRQGWGRRPLVWLSGVPRVGKTTLARMITDAAFYNCDLPSVRRMLRHPELLLESQADSATLIVDEVHRLSSPGELLKIVADEYPGLRLLATGPSTLVATRKFRDSLTGRKHSIHLQLLLWEECRRWIGSSDLDRRLLHVGLPEALLAQDVSVGLYSAWANCFYARDIQELFGVRNRHGFLAPFRLPLRQSGGQLQINHLSSDYGLSRPTVRSHLEALAITHAVHLLRRFRGGGRREIVARPKCYGFDTGLVCFERGWMSLRPGRPGRAMGALGTRHVERDRQQREALILAGQDEARAGFRDLANRRTSGCRRVHDQSRPRKAVSHQRVSQDLPSGSQLRGLTVGQAGLQDSTAEASVHCVRNA